MYVILNAREILIGAAKEDNSSMSYVHLAKDDLLKHYPWEGSLDLLNIVMIGIANELPEHDEEYELHRLLSAFFV